MLKNRQVKSSVRACGQCKKTFPIGKGHNARTCGQNKKVILQKGATRVTKIVPKLQKGEQGRKVISETPRKIKVEVGGEKVGNLKELIAREESLRKLNVFLCYSPSTGEVMLEESKEMTTRKRYFLPRSWLKDYTCLDDGDTIVWFNEEGLLHRSTGKPAIIYQRVIFEGRKEWWVNGKQHRLDGPAVEWADGGKEWWVDGKLHRLDGPAYEPVGGAKAWYANGELHRLDGPAVISLDGKNQWYLNGERHRLDGPAVEYVDGSKEWWVDGEQTDFPHLCEKAVMSDLTRKEFFRLCSHEDYVVRQLVNYNPHCPREYKLVVKLLNT